MPWLLGLSIGSTGPWGGLYLKLSFQILTQLQSVLAGARLMGAFEVCALGHRRGSNWGNRKGESRPLKPHLLTCDLL